MTLVAQLLQAKSGDIWTVAPDASVYDAIRIMADRGVGALMVTDGGRLVGVISERDYARKVILQGRSSRETSVREIMSVNVLYVRPEQTVEECMALMTEKRIRHLPVMTDKGLSGVISIGDLVKSVISEQEIRIQQLENYITGR